MTWSIPEKDAFDPLPKDRLVQKLSELSWQPTRTGIPGISVSKLNDEQKQFLKECKAKGLVARTQSASLKGEAYYCYNPEVIFDIMTKTHDYYNAIKDQNKWDKLNKLVRKLPEIAELVEPFIRQEGNHSVVALPQSSLLLEDIDKAMGGLANFELHIPVRKDDKAQEFIWKLSGSPAGEALLGILYLKKKEKEEQQSLSGGLPS